MLFVYCRMDNFSLLQFPLISQFLGVSVSKISEERTCFFFCVSTFPVLCILFNLSIPKSIVY